MRLRRFEAQGFKNFVEPIVLDQLGDFVVLHGDNNVGKSNVLQAIDLFFAVLRAGAQSGEPTGQWQWDDGTFSTLLGQSRPDVFELGRVRPPPIVLRAVLDLSRDELEAAKLGDTFAETSFDVETRLLHDAESGRTTLHVSHIGLAGHEQTLQHRHPGAKTEVAVLASLMSMSLLSRAPHNSRFIRIRSKRTDQKTQEGLAAKLYEARDSTNLEVARRWERFEEAVRGFEDLLGPGRFVPIRPESAATLTFQNDRARIPVHLLGSGVQQVVSVIGELLCGGASIAAIEEPELHLKTALQERLREMLRALPGKPGAPSQIFITSHSPSFELADEFHHIERSPAGHPTATRRSRDQAALVLGASSAAVTSTGAATSWVSTDGVLRLPDRIRNHIGREHGGDVVFSLADDKTAELRAVETFLAKHGLDEPEGGS